MKSLITSAILMLSPLVSAHGSVTSPPARQPGPGMQKTCGEQVFNNQKSDNGGPVQQELNVAKSQKDYNPATCDLFLCKGYAFDDNKSNVQSFSPGQVVPFKAKITAPHTGTCNISIVDTKAGAVLGQPLLVFDEYASNSRPIPKNNTEFDIKMPMSLDGKCTQAGDCVVQWFWNAADAKQTYESCVDFTMGDAPRRRRRSNIRF
jgi:predicted carbohydrate-binding protein with CBM5 and CBM33 domain